MSTDAWEIPHAPVDEVEFTPWAEPGWLAYNGMSPEVEVCAFFALLVKLLKPRNIVETGVGQGYMTRAIVRELTGDQMLFCYESDNLWRDKIKKQPFWRQQDQAMLRDKPTPTSEVISRAHLCFFDSDFNYRLPEIELWDQHARSGAVALIHDTGERHTHDAPHMTVKEKIQELGLQGVWLHNPRGCFLAIKP